MNVTFWSVEIVLMKHFVCWNAFDHEQSKVSMSLLKPHEQTFSSD